MYLQARRKQIYSGQAEQWNRVHENFEAMSTKHQFLNQYCTCSIQRYNDLTRRRWPSLPIPHNHACFFSISWKPRRTQRTTLALSQDDQYIFKDHAFTNKQPENVVRPWSDQPDRFLRAWLTRQRMLVKYMRSHSMKFWSSSFSSLYGRG